LKSQVEVADYFIDTLRIFDKGDDLHLCTAFGIEKRVYLIDFVDHLCPAL
jgi:hypothetical protein